MMTPQNMIAEICHLCANLKQDHRISVQQSESSDGAAVLLHRFQSIFEWASSNTITRSRG